MDVQTAIEANAQLAKACKPGIHTFEYPTVHAQALAALDTSPGNSARDALQPQMCSAPWVVIVLVRVQLGGAPARSARKPFDGRHGANASLEHHRVVPIGTADQYKRDAPSVYDEMTLGAELAVVGRVGPYLLTPQGLGVEDPLMQARCQSI